MEAGATASLHPLDLPRLRSQPTAEVLLAALEGLVVPPPSWDRPAAEAAAEIALTSSRAASGSDSALAHWLTRLVGSDLWWIEDEEAKERIWSSASKRMAERCGRTAAPAMTRTFNVQACGAGADEPRTVAIALHEPPLTSDSMGLKTWASSYLLAKRLHHLVPSVLPSALSSSSPSSHAPPVTRALELGSGTGLVGLSAAALFPGWDLHLTDLPEVVPNLTSNIAANRHLFAAADILSPSSSSSSSSSTSPSSATTTTATTTVVARVLDWTQPLADAYWRERAGSFDVILASDPLYTPQHPELVVSCVSLFLRKPTASSSTAGTTPTTTPDAGGKFIIEHPLRPSHMAEVADCEARLTAAGLVRDAVGEEVGWDDWGVSSLQHERLRLGSGGADGIDADGGAGDDLAEQIGGVRCRWSVWRWQTV